MLWISSQALRSPWWACGLRSAMHDPRAVGQLAVRGTGMRLEELPLLGCQHKNEARYATTQDPDGVWQGGVVKRLADRGADNGRAGGRHKPLPRGSSSRH